MLREARDWAGVAADVVVKLPVTDAGIEVVRACAAERIRDRRRRVRQPGAGAGGGAAGAAYVSAPVGRADGVDGNDVIRKLVALFRTYDVRDRGRRGRRSASPPTSSTRRWRARTPLPRRPRWCTGSTPRARGRPTGERRDAGNAMRIRQHVNPLKSDLLDIADVPRVEAGAGARAGGRAGRGRGALPDRPGARRPPRRCSSASRSGASWSTRSTPLCAAAGLANVRSVFANMSVDMGRLFARRQRAALLPELSRSLGSRAGSTSGA